MIITKTPFRMSFFGGGTDMESFLKNMVVLFYQLHLTNIAMLMYATCHAFLIGPLNYHIQKRKEYLI